MCVLFCEILCVLQLNVGIVTHTSFEMKTMQDAFELNKNKFTLYISYRISMTLDLVIAYNQIKMPTFTY